LYTGLNHTVQPTLWANPLNQSLPGKIVIMFADVSGSTQLYERLGDKLAHDCIAASLDRIIAHARHYGGHLVETIGDEALLIFPQCDAAASAAIAMQQHFAREPVVGDHFIKIRIGFHYGPIEYDQTGHPFGDTINVAARVVALCDSGRIIATDSSLRDVGDTTALQLRPYQTTRVKGKTDPIRVQEVIWDREDATSLFNGTQLTQLTQLDKVPLQLQLYYQGQVVTVDPSSRAFLIGRDAHCNLIIESALASRAHAKIEYRWGEFYLIDHSTNGTHVEFLQHNHGTARSGEGERDADAEGTGPASPVRLHRREIALKDIGKIAIGTRIEQATESNLLAYKIVQT